MAAVLQLASGTAPAAPGAGYNDLYFDASNVAHTLSPAGVDKSLATTDITLVTANITDAAIVNAKLANMAEATIKGRAAAAGAGVPVDLTAAEVYTILQATLDAAYSVGVTDASWTAMTLTTGWDMTGTLEPDTVRTATPTYTALSYRKVNGNVYLRGCVNCNSASATPIATLPSGYRPAAPMFVNIIRSSGASTGQMQLLIGTDGGMQIPSSDTASTYHFDGVVIVPA